MSKQSKACDVKKGIRAYVLDRDKRRCVVCGESTWLQMAHVFVSRAHGGLGVPENIATLCVLCHMKMDNGRSHDQQHVQSIVHGYMRNIYPNVDIKKLKYTKG